MVEGSCMSVCLTSPFLCPVFYHKSLCQFLKKKVISLQNPIQGHSFSLSRLIPFSFPFHVYFECLYLYFFLSFPLSLCNKIWKERKVLCPLNSLSRVHFSFHLDRNLTKQDKDITREGQERDGRLQQFLIRVRETREMNWLKRRREKINQVLDLTADWWPIVNDTQSMKKRRDCESTWRFAVKNVLFIWPDCEKIPCPPVCC